MVTLQQCRPARRKHHILARLITLLSVIAATIWAIDYFLFSTEWSKYVFFSPHIYTQSWLIRACRLAFEHETWTTHGHVWMPTGILAYHRNLCKHCIIGPLQAQHHSSGGGQTRFCFLRNPIIKYIPSSSSLVVVANVGDPGPISMSAYRLLVVTVDRLDPYPCPYAYVCLVYTQ